ncbi:MAG TPA: hypothetical protein VF549_11380 [Solirubrobacteraceae bacterium]
MPVTLPTAARAAAALAALTAAAALARVSSWRHAVGLDAGQYLYVADVLLDGGTPYVDAANNKGPMTYLLFALIRLGAGTSMTAVRVVFLAGAVLSAVAFGAYVAHYAGRAAGVLVAATFALFAGLPAFEGDVPNTEHLALPFIVGSWWLATRSAGSRAAAVAAGAAAGTAVAMNPSFAVVLPFTAFELWRGAGPARPNRLALSAAGAAAIAVPLLIWIAAAGAWDAMWDQVVATAHHKLRSSVSHGTFDVPLPKLWLAGLAGLALACADRRLRRVALPLIAWAAACWGRIKFAGYEFPHHYYPALLALAGGLALGVAYVAERIPRPRVRWAFVVVALALPLWQGVVRAERATSGAAHVPSGRSLEPQVVDYAVADFVRAHTRAGDRILVAGGGGGIYWLAGRRANTPLFDSPSLRFRDDNVRRRAAAVRQRPPAALVTLPGVEVLDPTFLRLIDPREYRPAFALNGARVWLRAP